MSITYIRNHAKKCKASWVFSTEKKKLLNFFLTDADDRGISQEFQGNDIVYYIINPAKKNTKPAFFDKKGTQLFLLAKPYDCGII